MLKNQYELRVCEVDRGQFEVSVYLKREGKPDRFERGVGTVPTHRLMLAINDMLKCMSPRCRDEIKLTDNQLLHGKTLDGTLPKINS